MRFRFPRGDQIHEVANLPAMAVDLGFGAAKSCGLAWQVPGGDPKVKCVNFGRCVEEVAGFLSQNAESALIVEAPLSGLFDPSGNPIGRTPFERSTINGRTSLRYWYVQAGAAVGLGAMFLFTRISQMVTLESNVVNLFEGFVSFKTRRSDHTEDAFALLNSLRNPATAEVYSIEPSIPGERSVNMLSIAGLVSPEEPCPAVVVVKVEDSSGT
jgi:hypothetical protein